MEVLFRGRLSYELRVSHVLEQVRDLKTKGVTFLFLRSPDHTTEGVVSIWNARFLTSAHCFRTTLSGYPALKQLLTLANADFAYGKALQDEVSGIEHELNIELKNIIPVLPYLPENLSELFDQDSLLDKVFTAQLEPSTPNQIQPPLKDGQSQPKGEHQVWQFFKSLLTASNPATEKKPSKRKSKIQPGLIDPRTTLTITHQRINRPRSWLGSPADIFKFWARTEFLVVATALVTTVALLWLWEEVGPSVSRQFKDAHSDFKSLIKRISPRKS